MADSQENQPSDLDAKIAQLQAQLDARPSIFDISPPKMLIPDPAAESDNALRAMIKFGTVFSIVVAVVCIGHSIVALLSPERSSANPASALIPVVLLGGMAFSAIRLLWARIQALESDVNALRKALSPQGPGK